MDSIIRQKSFDFALHIIELFKFLTKNNEYVISKQILRSGTSIGANVEEALGAISKRDFISKMSIASKEARETIYWLRLLSGSQLVNCNLKNYIFEADELIKILTSIVKSSQEKLKES